MKEKTIDRFLEIAAAVKTSAVLDDQVKKWFLSGVDRCLSGENLQQALGLNGARYQWLLKRRNEHLLAAWGVLPLSEETTEWTRCQALAQVIQHFKAIVWPRLERGGDAARLNSVQRHLLLAFKTGLSVPETGQQIQSIVKSVPASHLTPDGISYSLSLNHPDEDPTHEIQ